MSVKLKNKTLAGQTVNVSVEQLTFDEDGVCEVQSEELAEEIMKEVAGFSRVETPSQSSQESGPSEEAPQNVPVAPGTLPEEAGAENIPEANVESEPEGKEGTAEGTEAVQPNTKPSRKSKA